MTPDVLRSLASDSRVPEGEDREDERQWQKRDEALRTLLDEDFARSLALLCAELGEALEWALDVHELTLRRLDELDPSSDPEHMRIRAAGMAKARAALAKLEELGA